MDKNGSFNGFAEDRPTPAAQAETRKPAEPAPPLKPVDGVMCSPTTSKLMKDEVVEALVGFKCLE